MRKHTFGRLAAELVIVVAGVMIALAADSWRERVLDSRIEQQYLGRLRADLVQGVSVLTRERERFSSVASAARGLVVQAERAGGLSGGSALIAKLAVATRMGFDRQQLASDVTFQELVASGQLALLTQPRIREGLVAHYRTVERLATTLEELPELNEWVARLTGYYPYVFDGNVGVLTPAELERVGTALAEDPGVLADLNQLHAQLLLADGLFATAIDGAADLLSLVE